MKHRVAPALACLAVILATPLHLFAADPFAEGVRTNDPLTAEEQNLIDSKQPIKEFQKQLREKKAEEQREEPPFDPDKVDESTDVPF